MRIFILGAGATGSYLAHLLARQGHQVTCGDRDLDRARRFLGKRSKIPVVQVNARNLWGIVRAARGSQLVVNASAAVFNEIVLRAAWRYRQSRMPRRKWPRYSSGIFRVIRQGFFRQGPSRLKIAMRS